jgi:hypothetical protein
MSNEKKSPEKAKKPLKIKVERQLSIPKFCNLAAVNTYKDSDEVILDFFYVEKQIKTEQGESPANSIARIGMTKSHAIKLNQVLTKVLTEKKK